MRVKTVQMGTKGVVTEKYPAKPIEVFEGFRGVPIVDAEKCIGCGACARACPPNAITIKRTADYIEHEFFVGRCIFCGRCADVCPTDAIEMTKNFELSVDESGELYRVVRIAVAKCPICGRPVGALNMVLKTAQRLPEDKRYMAFLCPACKKKLSQKEGEKG